jgi:23S rRNA pseudouridine1911/1915/1917 synthase
VPPAVSHTITAIEAGARCDIAIARLSGASRARVAAAIRSGDVRLNGEIPKQATPVLDGDVLQFSLADKLVLDAGPEDIELDIVFEDDALLVVDKPAGMVTHPAHGARDGTLANALVAHVGALPGDPARPGLVHRLDRDTSGLLVVAKTDAVLRALGKAMMRRAIERVYVGLVVGIPLHAAGTIDGALGRDPHNRLKYAIRADGKPSVTHYEVREKLHGHSEVQFVLETGRTHQIRVHMAAFGHPIVNDPVYGRLDPRVDLPGQALHAWKLAFVHPVTNEALAFESARPPDYVAALEALRRP